MGPSESQPPQPTPWIALLGRRDEPTDGVEDYCNRLKEGLGKQRISLTLERVPWFEQGWKAALDRLSREARSWRGRTVLLQYTALSWSRRGLPLGFLAALWILRRRGARCAVIFHDLPYPGNRQKDRMRRRLQRWVMRTAYRWSERSILTLALENAAWLRSPAAKASFIPVGANIPSLDDLAQEGWTAPEPGARPFPAVAVFGITNGPPGREFEVAAIVHAMRAASARLGRLELVVMGRGSTEAEEPLREGLEGSSVVLTTCGVIPAREISMRLAACDAYLYVRGALKSGSGSGLAAIACGLPMAAFRGNFTAFPLTEGGIRFVPVGDFAALGEELTRILADAALRAQLRAQNLALFRKWLSWDGIARRLAESLGENGRTERPEVSSAAI